MKKTTILSAVLTLFLLVPASITWAQTITSQKGLTTAVFNLQQGILKLYLPDDIRPGDVISGTVVAEPIGKNAKQAASNLVKLGEYFVSINNIKFPVNNAGKPFLITMPPGKPIPCRIALMNASGVKVLEQTVPSLPEKESFTGTDKCNIPSHALTASPLRISGVFDGDASNTRCNLDGKSMEVLAESPRLSIVSFPVLPVGMYVLSSQEKGRSNCTKKITAVDMSIIAGKMNLLKGEKTYIDVKLTGLQNLPDTARLTVTNISTNVITMQNGNNTTVSIPPPAETARGIFIRRFDVQSIKTGTFAVNVNLDLPETGTADSTYTQPFYNMKVWLHLKDGNINAFYDGQTEDAKINGGENVYVIDNVMRIFLNGIFLHEFDLANSGTRSVQDILTAYSDENYAAPDIGCDSLRRICKKNAALNVFWGDIYSVFEGKVTSKYIKGETVENTSQNSLLITRGWEINCCTGEFQLKLFFQAMQGGDETGGYNVVYSKILKTVKPCTIDCSK